ncbi:Two component transcriptional regulator, LuxR family [Bosea sp. LC85]|uniref:response regulator n=1 Tax=Bosea sp. LC85 TaxID=1502851 RepID=UPI0004E3F453|nr:response regulator transcription factor [Bosea sp. LC85]KFC68865.1 Two component transcriptional regulator, LuxR family [Bosea sp. LC85]
MRERKSIIVVDDHAIFRAGLVQIFSASGDLEVVGEGASADEAVALVGKLAPQIALLDVSMPGGGIAAARRIHQAWPQVKVVMLTVSEEEDVVLQALDAGASGYALKGVPAVDLIAIVRAITGGESYVPPNMAVRLLSAMRGQQEVDPVLARIGALSAKENRTLRLLGRGFSNREIAEATGVQIQTTKFHVSNILAKLGLKSRVEAALIAQKHLQD